MTDPTGKVRKLHVCRGQLRKSSISALLGLKRGPNVDMQVKQRVVPGGVLYLTRTGTAPHITELCQACSAAGIDLEHSPGTPEIHLWTLSWVCTKFKGVGIKNFLQTRTSLLWSLQSKVAGVCQVLQNAHSSVPSGTPHQLHSSEASTWGPIAQWQRLT